MQAFGSRFYRLVKAGAFIVLLAASYYSCCYRLPVGVKYAVNLLIVGWAAAEFMVCPRVEDLKFCLRFLLLFSLVYIIPWVWSMLVWIYDLRSLDYITRGSLNIFYMITTVGCVCASFYLFHEKAVPYMLIAMAIANGLVLVEVAGKYGFAELFTEYIELVLSFAGKTGAVVRRMELHDMVFGWGAFLIYYAMRPTKRPWQRWLYLLISFFFFTVAFKRIGAMAVAGALSAAFVYQRMSERSKLRALRVSAVLFTGIAIGYICMVRSGLFYEITEAMGINLMGRKTIYSSYNDHYDLSPFFMGHGVRYVYQYGVTVSGITALHNDFLGLYIEVGFFTWFLWMWYEFYYRGRRIGQRFSYQATVNLMACSVYMYITFMTDNPFYQYPININCYLTAMVWCWEAAEKNKLKEKERARLLPQTN